MSKYAPIFLLLLISLTQGEIRRSRRGKHGEDCVSDAACDEGFFAKHIVVSQNMKRGIWMNWDWKIKMYVMKKKMFKRTNLL